MIMGDVATVVARPQSVAYLQPRQARQHPVEYDKIGRRVGEAQFRLVAAIDMLGEPCRVEGRTGLSREIGFSRDGEGRQIRQCENRRLTSIAHHQNSLVGTPPG